MSDVNEILILFRENAKILSMIVSGIVGFIELAGILEKIGIFERANVPERIRVKISWKFMIGVFICWLGILGIGCKAYDYAEDLVRVPLVEGNLYSDAKNILDEHTLGYNTEQRRENCKVERQTPEAGSVVLKWTKIYLELEDVQEPTTPPSPTVPATPTPTNTPTPTHAHDYTWNVLVTEEPTCTSVGIRKNVCECGVYREETIPRLDHTYADDSDAYCNACNEFRAVDCKITFNSDGGSSIASKTVKYGTTLSNLPEPSKDYYDFTGWTYNGQKVTSINVEHDMVLVATWEAKRESDWVLASDVPSGARLTDEKWTYTKRETTESISSSLAGWISNGNRTETVAEGTFEYADFPMGFDTSSSIYKGMYQSKSGPAVADGATREILSDTMTGYVYWHYAFPLEEPCDAGNRTVGPAYNTKLSAGDTTIFNAFKSSKNYTITTTNSAGGGTIYKITDVHTTYKESGGSYWWFRFEYNTCTYKDIRKIYKYYKTTQMESATEVLPNNEISNVTKWVKYIEK